MREGSCVLVRVWDTTGEKCVTAPRPCDARVMTTRLDSLYIPDIPASFEPGTVIVLALASPSLTEPIVARPALVLYCGSFTPDGHPIVDVLADPEYLPEA